MSIGREKWVTAEEAVGLEIGVRLHSTLSSAGSYEALGV